MIAILSSWKSARPVVRTSQFNIANSRDVADEGESTSLSAGSKVWLTSNCSEPFADFSLGNSASSKEDTVPFHNTAQLDNTEMQVHAGV